MSEIKTEKVLKKVLTAIAHRGNIVKLSLRKTKRSDELRKPHSIEKVKEQTMKNGKNQIGSRQFLKQ